MADDKDLTTTHLRPGALPGNLGTATSPAKRMAALLDAPDPAAAVAALSVPELYEIVTQVGFADTQELIELATPSQVRGCIDIDAWDRHELTMPTIRPWLAALVEIGPEKTTAVWEALDSEMRALLLQRHTVIYDLSLGEEPDDSDGAELLFTVDSFFCVKLLGDEEHNRLVRRLIADLYMGDSNLARHTLMAARSEPPAELEDYSYRWRSGRMADLGFVDYYEALELFRVLEPSSVAIGENSREVVSSDAEETHGTDHTLTALAKDELRGTNFFSRVLDALLQEAPQEAAHFEVASALLVNKLLSAARVRLGDSDAVVRAARYAFATLSLGLEHISQGSVDRAKQALQTVSLMRLHRLGFSVSIKVAKYARALVPNAKLADDGTHRILAALAGARPWMPKELDTPPATGVRPFASVKDVSLAAQALAIIALRIRIAEGLGANLTQRSTGEVTLDDFARTALVRALLGEAMPTARPIDASEFAALKGLHAERIDKAALAAASARLVPVWQAMALEPTPFLDALLLRYSDELEDMVLSAPALDARYISGVLIAVGR